MTTTESLGEQPDMEPQHAEALEYLHEFLGPSWANYNATVEAINANRSEQERIGSVSEEEFGQLFDSWLMPETPNKYAKLDYLAGLRERGKAEAGYRRYPEVPLDVVAVPNVVVTTDEILSMPGFSVDHRVAARTLQPYTPEQLSGTHPQDDEAVQFAIVSRMLIESPAVPEGPLEEKLAQLTDAQQTYPFLRQPSFLEEVVRLHGLESRGFHFEDPRVRSEIFNLHTQLPLQAAKIGDLGEQFCLPRTVVAKNEFAANDPMYMLMVDTMPASDPTYIRVAVG
jgi:hypothetical protein